MPKWIRYYQNPDSFNIDADISINKVPKRSIYQSDATTFKWFIENEKGGHPPLSDILASVFNTIFFQKLRIVNDVDSYRIYGIFMAAVGVFLVFIWADKIYGRVAAIIAALSLSFYPLFWSEAHFNIEKDIPETVFIMSMLYFFWRGFREEKNKLILIGGIFFGLALGTKFNVLFSFLPLLIWLIVSRKNILKLVFPSVVGIGIFLASWPFLWGDPIGGILKVASFYKTIGITQNVDTRFLGPFGINIYPLEWILFTTPPIILILFSIGITSILYRLKKERDLVSLLILLAFAVPIARVTWPGATVYGGIRQIMEFIPPMAILAGLGGSTLYNFLKKNLPKTFAFLILILPFTFLILNLYRIHPNENVYFNFLIGGLSGAKKIDLPSWGNTFGAAYRQGISWINKNAPPGSKVVLVYELLPNIPNIFVRSDIEFQNSNRSGYLRRGEYAITLVYQGVENRSYYDMYLNEFIEPVYQVRVDNVPILKVWKNDENHLKRPVKEEVVKATITKNRDGVRFDLGGLNSLSRLEISYKDLGCKPLSFGYVRISADGKKWIDLPGILPKSWKVSALGEQPKDGYFIEPFVGQKARFIELILAPADTCLKNIEEFKIFTLL